MTAKLDTVSLDQLDLIPYLDGGKIPESLTRQIGVYAIFDRDKILKYVGYSRDVFQSLKQHLVRQPRDCHWLKVQTITRPSRTLLEEIRTAWIAENGSVPPGNGGESDRWNQPIDVRPQMTPEEISQFQTLDELAKEKLLKTVARRVEAQILEELAERGVQENIRFNPKLKTSGILDVK
ncbi:MAG: GIY-YIG nuclease family protein [Limnospira sp.]